MGMGVKGAAWATVIGNISSTIFYLGYIIFSRKTFLSFNPKYFSLKEGIPFGVLVIGIPAFLNNLLMSTSNILTNNFLVKYGDVAVAGMGVAMKANMLVVFLQLGIAMGIQPLIGYCYGAKNYVRLKSVMKFSMICSVIIGFTLTITYLIFSKNIVGIFIQNEDVIIFGEKMLRALMLSSSLIGIMFVFTFSFQAMGKAISSLVLSVSRQGLIFFPVLVLSNLFFGLNGIIFAQPIADLGCLLTALIMFVHLNKQWKQQGI
jgi:Na+-driven multidrug efflux pump